ncbi:MAG: capsule assembly Wzi family protein [Leadbetterella sp.]
MKYLSSLFTLFILGCLNVSAQKFKLNSSVSSGFIVSMEKQSPYFFRANQYGVTPKESGIFYFSPRISKDFDSLYSVNSGKLNRFDYGFVLEPHINTGLKNQILLPEAHVKVRYGAFEFYGGRRREVMGLVDTSCTMGSFIWSGNALPIPKLQIAIPNYTPIIGKGLVSIKGNFAHGWFGTTDSVRSYFLHQKSFYARLGRPNWKMKMHFGFNHQVQWGGYPERPYFDPKTKKQVTDFGNNFGAFMKVFTGVSLGGKDNENVASGNEATNRQGNHLGTVDIAFELSSTLGRFFLYRQSIYEDGSLYHMNNIKDGLYGLSYSPTNAIFKRIVFEYMHTQNQGGKYFNDFRNELRGLDNYFNNAVYIDGWRYKANTMGNPLLSSDALSTPYVGVYNNMIEALFFGAIYKVGYLHLKTNLILANHQGNIVRTQYFKNQYSILQSFSRPFKKFDFQFDVSADRGEYLNPNLGLHLRGTKSF